MWQDFDVRSASPLRLQGMMKLCDSSHLDHGLTLAHVVWLLARFADRDGFFIETVELPPELPSLSCGLHGPIVGDAPVAETEVVYARRGNRRYASRMVDRPARLTRSMTVVAGPHGNDRCVLFTAYGGPKAPRETLSPGLEPSEVAESETFWAEHALSLDTEG